MCRVFGLIPAAGMSQRMGRQKLALPLGERSVLEQVVHRLPDPLDGILVVLSPATAFLGEILPEQVSTLLLDNQTEEMRATVQSGIDHLQKLFSPDESDGVLLALGDHPSIRKSIGQSLVDLFKKDPSRIYVPMHDGRRGHPVIFPWSILSKLPSVPADQGVNALHRNYQNRLQQIEFDHPDLLEDMDYPEDYERMRGRVWK